MKLTRFLPALMVASFLLVGVQAKADWSYNAVCSSLFGFSASCYADDYIPNLTVWNIDFYSDCTFMTNVGGEYRRYHTTAHYPDYGAGWHYMSWGVTSDFRTVDSDSGYKMQQLIDGTWQDIMPCDP